MTKQTSLPKRPASAKSTYSSASSAKETLCLLNTLLEEDKATRKRIKSRSTDSPDPRPYHLSTKTHCWLPGVRERPCGSPETPSLDQWESTISTRAAPGRVSPAAAGHQCGVSLTSQQKHWSVEEDKNNGHSGDQRRISDDRGAITPSAALAAEPTAVHSGGGRSPDLIMARLYTDRSQDGGDRIRRPGEKATSFRIRPQSAMAAVCTAPAPPHRHRAGCPLVSDRSYPRTSDRQPAPRSVMSRVSSATRCSSAWSSASENCDGAAVPSSWSTAGRVSSAPAGGRRAAMTPVLADNYDYALNRLKRQSLRRRSARLSAGVKQDILRSRRPDSGGGGHDGGVSAEDEGEEAAEQHRQTVRRRLRRAFRLVCLVLRFGRHMQVLSGSLAPRTVVEMQFHTLHSATTTEALAFNPAAYRHNKGSLRLPGWARASLCEAPAARSPVACLRLHALLRGLKALAKFTEKIQLAMCRAAHYYSVASLRVILRQGHIGQNFYIIYSGSVFINMEDESTGEYRTETTLAKGDSFGELALLRDCPRSATVVAREPCELLVVDKEVFAQLCPKIFDMELEEKLVFLSSLQLFTSQHWTQPQVHKLCLEAQIQEHKTNKVVVQDSANDEWMYICMQGRCNVIKCLRLGGAAEEQDDVTRQTLDVREEDVLVHDHHHKMALKLQDKRKSIDVAMKKNQLLEAMGLDWYRDEKDQWTSRAAEEARALADGGDAQAVAAVDATSRTLTLTEFIKYKAAAVGAGGGHFIYLKIGILEQGQVFDLVESVAPSSGSDSSCLVLVSSGARLLRLKKAAFRSALTAPAATEYTKILAAKQMYPQNSELVTAFREKQAWDKYRQTVVEETMGPLLSQARRRETVAAVTAAAARSKRRKEQQVLSTLSRHQDDQKVALQHDCRDGGQMALDARVLDDADDDTVYDRIFSQPQPAATAQAPTPSPRRVASWAVRTAATRAATPQPGAAAGPGGTPRDSTSAPTTSR